MHKITLPTCSLKEHTFSILGDITVKIEVVKNPFDLPLDSLFDMAARKNKKRGFLFVSKVLGKHIPVKPTVSLLGGAALASHYLSSLYGINHPLTPSIVEALRDPVHSEDTFEKLQQNLLTLPEKVVFIGFAETATALGHSMFASFKENAHYIHTTRDMMISQDSIINFEEEHSHATSHRCYALHPNLFGGEEPIILVDDEMTTGKTALNIIRDIQRKFPRKKYVVASLLDWRSEVERDLFKQVETELEISIQTISLLEGRITVQGHPLETSMDADIVMSSEDEIQVNVNKINLNQSLLKRIFVTSEDSTGTQNDTPYLLETGRFGISTENMEEIHDVANQIGKELKRFRTFKKNKTLCLGTGEFMYIPMLIASYMGEGVVYHSTTRSPIHPCNKEDYGAKNKFVFQNPDDPNVINYVYNIPWREYDDLFLFLERDVTPDRLQTMINTFAQVGITQVYVVVCSSNHITSSLEVVHEL